MPKHTLLFVDDEPWLTKALRITLKEHGLSKTGYYSSRRLMVDLECTSIIVARLDRRRANSALVHSPRP
jgi:hypothetical protein